MQITKDFNVSEFECRCRNCEIGNIDNIKKLAKELQIIRDYFGKPIKINSGYRCETHNKAIGGVANSHHTLSKAADIAIKGITPKEIANTLEELISSGQLRIGAIGIYNTFVHVDIRTTIARWDNRSR
jgi:uncharacterized protein YcbK (DUF882 family)